MKRKDARKWIEALRSGKYNQGRNKLRSDDNKYCCLGVLNAIFPKLNLRGACTRALDNYKLIGLKDSGGQLTSRVSLFELNDSGFPMHDGQWICQPLTFDEIADVIQIEYVEGL